MYTLISIEMQQLQLKRAQLYVKKIAYYRLLKHYFILV